jgi:hypothetical protein
MSRKRGPATRFLAIVVTVGLLIAAATTYARVDPYRGTADFPHVGRFSFQAEVHRGKPVKVRRFRWRTTVLCWKGSHEFIRYRVHGRFHFGMDVRNDEGTRRFWGRATNGKGKHTHVRGHFVSGPRVKARGVFNLYGRLNSRLNHCHSAHVDWRAGLETAGLRVKALR